MLVMKKMFFFKHWSLERHLTNVSSLPYANSINPKSRACKLPDVQGNLTKRPREEKVFYWLITIANVIAHFTHVAKDLEFKKMKMTKFIKFQMLQNEKKAKMMFQNELQWLLCLQMY